MKIEVEGMEQAQVFWGIAIGKRLHALANFPVLFESEEVARSLCAPNEHPVRVYLIVEKTYEAVEPTRAMTPTRRRNR